MVNLVHAYALVREASGVCVASRRAAAAPRRCLSMGTTSSDDSLLPVVALSTGDSTAEVHLFGGCVTSYSKGGIEQLAHRPRDVRQLAQAGARARGAGECHGRSHRWPAL